MDSKSPNYNPGSKPQVHFVKRSGTAYIKDTIRFDISWADTAIGGGEGAIKTYYFDWNGQALFKDSLAGDSVDIFSAYKAFPSAGTRTVRVKAVDYDGRYSNIDSMRLVVRESSPRIVVVTVPASIEKGRRGVVDVSARDSGGTIRMFVWAKNGKDFKDTSISGTIYVSWPDTGEKLLLVKAFDDKNVVSPVETLHVRVLDNFYTVKYNGNGNSSGAAPVDTGRYASGQNVPVLANSGNLAKSGYTFVGWNTAADGSGIPYATGVTVTIVSSSVTLYAQWTKSSTYSVVYDGNGNSGGTVPVDANNYTRGTTVMVLGNTGNLARSGFTFIGWNTAADGSGLSYESGATFVMDSMNMALYARWTKEPTYTLVYNGNGSSGGSVPIDENNYLSGASVTVSNPGSLANAGHSFTGWNTAADGSGTSYTAGAIFIMGTSNVVLYAQWDLIQLFTVTYSGNGNTGGTVPTDSARYASGQNVTVRSNSGILVKAGFVFIGWNTAADGSGFSYSVGVTFAMGSSNVNLYAQWTANPTYSVVYDGNGHSGGAVPVDANSYPTGATVTVLGNTGNLARTGYTFVGWNTAPDGGGTSYTAGATVVMGTVNVTLYAQWTANPTYTVAYNGNNNTGGALPVDANNYPAGAMVTVLGPGSLVKSGYSFAGWNTAANGSGAGYAAGVTFSMGSSNVTLYAQWALIPTYTVTYNGNGNTGGSVPSDGKTYTTGATVTVLGNTGNLARTGFTFVGWNTNADGSGIGYPVGVTFQMGTANVALYAQWTANPTYTVTYNGNGSSGGNPPQDNNRYLTGATVTVRGNTGNLARTGYTFIGWNTAANGSGTNYAAGATFAMGSANVALYARWTANPTYTVTYNGNGSTGGTAPVDANKYLAGATVTVLNVGSLVKAGSSFKEWNTAANGSGKSYAAGVTFAMGAANVVLYAQWSLVPGYSVTYNGNGSTGGNVPVDGGRYLTGATVTVLGNNGNLARTGFTFNGWNTKADGSGISYSAGSTFVMGTANVALYAQWVFFLSYSVTYSGNGNTGGSVPVDDKKYSWGATVKVLGNTGDLVKTGYTFAGWNTKADGSGTDRSPGATFAMGLGNVTLFARWTSMPYTVTYDGNGSTGGSATDPNSYSFGQTVTVRNAGTLVKTGYSFTGWNRTADGSGKNFAVGDTLIMGASFVTLYAQWSAVPYHVTYNGNGNTGGSAPIDTTTYTIGQTITVLNAGTLSKAGNLFSGWTRASDGSGKKYTAGDTLVVGPSDVALNAQWSLIPIYSVKYEGNGGTGGSVPVDTNGYLAGATVTVLTKGSLEKAGYSFTSWNTTADGKGTSRNPGSTFIMGSSDVTLYAQWSAVPYHVTYNGNGNTGGSAPIDTNAYVIGQNITVLDSGTLVNTGFTFGGWNTLTDGSGTTYVAGDRVQIGAADVNLYAVWKQ